MYNKRVLLDKDTKEMRHVMPYVIDIAAIVFIYVKWMYPTLKNQAKEKFVVTNLLIIYLVFVGYFTLMPVIVNLPNLFVSSYEMMNFIPFIDLQMRRPLAMREIILNVVMLVPFGVLLPLLKNQNIIQVGCKAFLLSVAIELIQPAINSYRAFDVTDIITNTFGALVGYVLYLLLKKPLQVIIKGLAKVI